MFRLTFLQMLSQLTDGQIFLETEFYFIEEFVQQINTDYQLVRVGSVGSNKKQCASFLLLCKLRISTIS